MDAKTLETIAEFLGAALAGGLVAIIPILRSRINTYLKSRSEEYIPNSFIKNKQIVAEVLTELRICFNADRVRIFQFHNHEHFAPNNPCWRITNTFEVCHPGVSHEQGEIQGVLASAWLDVVQPILTGESTARGVTILSGVNTKFEALKGVDKNIILFEVDRMPDSACRQTLFRQGVRFALMTNLHNKGRAFGFLSVSFVHDIDNMESVTNKLKDFIDLTDRIQYILISQKE